MLSLCCVKDVDVTMMKLADVLERQGEEGNGISWPCTERLENKALNVIPLIHPDTTEAII